MDNPILTPSGDGQGGMSRARFLRNAALLGFAGGAALSFGPKLLGSNLLGPRAAEAAEVGYINAYSMSFTDPNISVIADSAASSGQALRFASPGSASKRVNLSSAATEVAVRARGVSGGGTWPRMRVSVDGNVVLDKVVTSSSYTTFAASGLSIPAGSHNVVLASVGWSASGSRLIVDVIRFRAPDAPSAPGIALGAHVGQIAHQGLQPMHNHISKTGVVPRITLVHQSWQWNGSYDAFPTSGINGIYNTWPNTMVMLTWSQVYGTWPTISSIADGQHDSYIREYANAVKSFGKRIILRPFAEMNGDWYKLFSSQPTAFVNAWRRIVNIFREVGVPNVQWFWCPNATGNGYYGLEEYYPGDGYVYWVGLDGYNWAAAHNTPWQWWGEIFTGDLDRLSNLYPSKRQIIGEFGCHTTPGDKPAWFRDVHQYLKTNRHPKLAGIVYYDYNADGATWAIDQPLAALDAYKAMAQDAYFKASL